MYYFIVKNGKKAFRVSFQMLEYKKLSKCSKCRIKVLCNGKLSGLSFFYFENFEPQSASHRIATHSNAFTLCVLHRKSSVNLSARKTSGKLFMWKWFELHAVNSIDMINDAHAVASRCTQIHTVCVYVAHDEILLLLVERTLSKHNRLPTIQYSSRA